MKYKVHIFQVAMTRDAPQLELLLNSIEGEIVAIIPNVETVFFGCGNGVNLLWIVEKLR